jgi:hypothetical protein
MTSFWQDIDDWRLGGSMCRWTTAGGWAREANLDAHAPGA